jgi:GT2 family glycosyltransferase
MQSRDSTVPQQAVLPSAAPALTFVIPVRNDAARLRRCLASIKDTASRVAEAVEIIVGDNGSTDDTPRVAADAGAAVLSIAEPGVARVRNAGARSARGDAIAFVDADHELDVNWAPAAIESLRDHTVWAAGDQCHAPRDGTWVQLGYDVLRRHESGIRDAEWLPSGNLVVRRTAFERVGGFDPNLETCEDVDLSQRMRAAGARLITNDRLRSIHYGDPSSLRALFWGELWRGRDNLRVSLRVPLTLRGLPSLVIPLVNLAALATILGGCLAWPVAGWRLPAAGAILLAFGLGARSFALLYRTRATDRRVSALQVVMISAVYDLARSLALVSRVGHDRRRT